jgi:hypothetical protein
MGSINPYDETLEWLPEQREMTGAPYSDLTYYASWQQQTQVNYPYYTGNIAGAQTIVQSNLGPQLSQQNQKASDRMPKAQAVAIARTLKRSIVVASIAVFGVLSGLVATHLQTTATGQSTSAAASQNTSSNTSSSSNSSSTSSSNNSNFNAGSDQNPSDQNPSNTNSGGFFNQQGGGYGFGNGGSAQPPVSNSRVS